MTDEQKQDIKEYLKENLDIRVSKETAHNLIASNAMITVEISIEGETIAMDQVIIEESSMFG